MLDEMKHFIITLHHLLDKAAHYLKAPQYAGEASEISMSIKHRLS